MTEREVPSWLRKLEDVASGEIPTVTIPATPEKSEPQDASILQPTETAPDPMTPPTGRPGVKRIHIESNPNGATHETATPPDEETQPSPAHSNVYAGPRIEGGSNRQKPQGRHVYFGENDGDHDTDPETREPTNNRASTTPPPPPGQPKTEANGQSDQPETQAAQINRKRRIGVPAVLATVAIVAIVACWPKGTEKTFTQQNSNKNATTTMADEPFGTTPRGEVTLPTQTPSTTEAEPQPDDFITVAEPYRNKGEQYYNEIKKYLPILKEIEKETGISVPVSGGYVLTAALGEDGEDPIMILEDSPQQEDICDRNHQFETASPCSYYADEAEEGEPTDIRANWFEVFKKLNERSLNRSGISLTPESSDREVVFWYLGARYGNREGINYDDSDTVWRGTDGNLVMPVNPNDFESRAKSRTAPTGPGMAVYYKLLKEYQRQHPELF